MLTNFKQGLDGNLNAEAELLLHEWFTDCFWNGTSGK